ncbi:hypothetical protein ACFVVM_03265 [Nocardia sp. NPDC058176]|uniref:TY-Chap domain-containing protein n=1 Tax=Nocardia sp. NPDC058176 TaxID=3346368 RepID=UPI0036DE9972
MAQWAALLERMRWFFEPDWNDDDWQHSMNGRHIQLRDHRTGYRVEFFANGNDVQVFIDVPDNEHHAAALSAYCRNDPDHLWRERYLYLEEDDDGTFSPPIDGPRQWESGWRQSAGSAQRPAIVCLSVIEVMRDVLGMSPDHLRSSVWGRDRPGDDTGWGLASVAVPDRPTRRGRAEQCTDWADFVDRLEWVLTTMPWSGVLIISAPSCTGVSSFVQFYCELDVLPEVILHDHGELSPEDCRRRMYELGWSESDSLPEIDAPLWVDPNSETETRPWRRALATRTAETFRSVLSVDNPQHLNFTAFCQNFDDDLAYLAAELGIRRETSDVTSF